MKPQRPKRLMSNREYEKKTLSSENNKRMGLKKGEDYA